MKRWTLWAPLAVFAILFSVVSLGLRMPVDRTVHSAMVGKPIPPFKLLPIAAGKPGVASADFGRGKPRLLNVFASWCLPCIAEAPQLMELKQAGVEIDGVAVRDTAPAITNFLERNGDPYAAIGDDPRSAIQLALGSSGVPETFVIDGRGKIVSQHIGDIRAEEVSSILAALRDTQ